MVSKADLEDEVARIFRSTWEKRAGRFVPDNTDVQLGNHAVEFDRATVLYADLNGSTKMVDSQTWEVSAEVYKTYLHCATKVILAEGGTITSYDGDRVMGIFIGDMQSTDAVRAALKINWAVGAVVNPKLKAQYPTIDFTVRQVIGIDTSPIRAARTGVRGNNDLVWIGRAANYAAKLTDINSTISTWITKDVYNKIANGSKYASPGGANMWKKYHWTAYGNKEIYGSSFRMIVQ